MDIFQRKEEAQKKRELAVSIFSPAVDVVYFTKDDPRRELLLIDATQTCENNLLQYETPVAYGNERKDLSIRMYHAVKKSSGYAKDTSVEIGVFCKSQAKDGDLTQHEWFIQQVFPPKEWIAQQRFWRQKISPALSGREDDVTLDLALMRMVKASDARLTFVSTIRRKIFDQLFDEILRKTLLENPTRGLLLLQCRDGLRQYLRMQIELCRSQVGFSGRKMTEATVQVDLAAEKRKRDRSERARLLIEQAKLMKQIAAFKEKARLRKRHLDSKFARDVESLLKENSLMTRQLNVMTDPKSYIARKSVRKLNIDLDQSDQSDYSQDY